MDLSRSPGKYHCALEGFSGVLSRLVHLRPVQKVMLQSSTRRHHQDRRTSFSPKEICDWRSQRLCQNYVCGLRPSCASPLPRRPADWRDGTDRAGNHGDEVKLTVFSPRKEIGAFFHAKFIWYIDKQAFGANYRLKAAQARQTLPLFYGVTLSELP